jgi:hypothetical protein
LYSFRSRPVADDDQNRTMIHSPQKAAAQTASNGKPVQ